MIKSIETIIVGTAHRNEDGSSRAEYIEKYIEDGKSLLLSREYSNAHDENAIAVLADTGGTSFGMIGYIPRDVAAKLAPMIDAGNQTDACVSYYDSSDHDELPIIEIEIRVYDNVDSMVKARYSRLVDANLKKDGKNQFKPQLIVVILAVLLFIIVSGGLKK